MNRLKNKVAVITGGSSGLGEAMGILFSKEGAKIVIADVDEDKGKQVENKVKNNGGEARFVHLDVTQEASWQKAINETIDTFGQLDIMVNSAGLGGSKNIEQVTFDEYKKLMAVNMDGVFWEINLL